MYSSTKKVDEKLEFVFSIYNRCGHAICYKKLLGAAILRLIINDAPSHKLAIMICFLIK